MRWILCCFLTSFVWGDEQLPFNSPQWPAILAEEHQLPEKLCEFTHWRPGLKLADLKEAIEEQHGIKVRFDPFETHIDDYEVGFSTRHTPLFQALNRLRSEHDLSDWEFKKNTLLIHCSDSRLTTRCYSVADFLEDWTKEDLKWMLAFETDGPWFEFDQLGGTVSFAGPLMVVRHVSHIHRQICHILSQLRSNEFPCRLLLNARDRNIEEKIRTSRNVSFGTTSLIQYAKRLSRKWQVDVNLDVSLLDNSINIGQVHRYVLSLGEMLTADDRRLVLFVEHGLVIIRPLDICSETYRTEVHDVRKLLPYFLAQEQLMKVVREETQGPWFEVDGIGGTVALYGKNKLFVRNTKDTRSETQRLLVQLCRQFSNHPDWQPPDDLIIETYSVPKGIQPKAFESLLYEQIAPESWTNPDLKVFAIWKRFHEKNKTEARLVVQHLESVHISIRKLINDLDESGNEGFPADAFGFGNR